MASSLRLLLCIILITIALTACTTGGLVAPTPTRVPTFQFPATLTPTVTSPPEATNTRVIPLATTPASTATRVTPTQILSPSPTIRPSPTPVPTSPPLTRIAAAESVWATTIAQVESTLTVIATGSPAPLDTYRLLDLAWIRGEIDIDHVAIFKIFALFGVRSPELPAQYISKVPPGGDGTGLFLYALKDWDKLNPATQGTVTDFITPREITQTIPFPTPTATPSVRLSAGVYATAITQGDNLKSELPQIGQWEYDATSGAVTLNGKRVITRSFSQEGNQIIFIDLYGSYACMQVSQKGIYRLALDGNSVTFTKISDPCESRSQVLTAHSWIKRQQ